MPPFIKQIVGALVRVFVVWAAGYLAAKTGVSLTEDQIGQIVTWLVPVVVVVGWSLRAKFLDRLKLLMATSRAGLTEHEVERLVADPDVPNPPVNTRKWQLP